MFEKEAEELEKEKCELLGIIQGKDKVIQELKKELNNMLVSKNQQLAKAKKLLTKWVELFKPKGGNIPPTPIQIETEQFLRENE